MLAQGDKDGDGALNRAEISALAATWFDALDPQKTGTLMQADFTARFPAVLTGQPAANAAGAPGGRAVIPRNPGHL